VNHDGRLDVLAGAYGEKTAGLRAGYLGILLSTTAGTPGAASRSLDGRAFTPVVETFARGIASAVSQH
jgi:hypothetical protein